MAICILGNQSERRCPDEAGVGREIKTDRIILHTRADFPHDNWWVKATVEFSDGSSMVLDLEKTDVSQEFSFEEKTISWLVLKELIKQTIRLHSRR